MFCFKCRKSELKFIKIEVRVNKDGLVVECFNCGRYRIEDEHLAKKARLMLSHIGQLKARILASSPLFVEAIL